MEMIFCMSVLRCQTPELALTITPVDNRWLVGFDEASPVKFLPPFLFSSSLLSPSASVLKFVTWNDIEISRSTTMKPLLQHSKWLNCYGRRSSWCWDEAELEGDVFQGFCLAMLASRFLGQVIKILKMAWMMQWRNEKEERSFIPDFWNKKVLEFVKR